MPILFRLSALLLLAAGAAASAQAPVATGYQPQDADERGLWMQMDEAERKLQTSSFIIRDPQLNAYVRQVFCKTVGADKCADVRIYLVRTADFNASMAPNGMMMIYSGLLLRMRNEAQLAAVLGHEYMHYSQQHSLKIFREIKSKTNTMAWLSVIPVANVAAAGAVAVMQVGLAGSIFSFSRENEAEADSGSIPMLVQAGYDPSAASLVWEQLRAEMDATAAARNQKSRKDKDRGIFGTHPPTADRVTTLGKLATPHLNAGGALQVNRAEYRQALVNFWAGFIDDQIKLNDFGGTEFLLQSLAGDGWTSELLYARGELYRARGKPEDLKQSAVYYRDATAQEDAPPEAWRGLGLALLRTGDTDPGKAALKQYLQRNPNAPDKAMMAMLAGE